MRIRIFSLIAIVAALANGTLAADDGGLQHNPFSRPAPEVIDESATRAATPDSDAALIVRATIVSKRGGLANVDGTVIGPGASINGYTLRRVAEDHAVFVRNGREFTVYVKPVESDEQ